MEIPGIFRMQLMENVFKNLNPVTNVKQVWYKSNYLLQESRNVSILGLLKSQ